MDVASVLTVLKLSDELRLAHVQNIDLLTEHFLNLKYSRSTLSSVRGFTPVLTGLDYGSWHVNMRPLSRHNLLPPGFKCPGTEN